VLPDRIPRGWGYPPPPPPGWSHRPPRASAGGGLAVLVAITVLAFLAAPHAHHLRPQVQAARAILAGNFPALPGLPAPKLQLPRPVPPSARPARPSPRAGAAVSFARGQLGKPYHWAAEGPGAYDCSGLTWAAWRAAGVSIPRTAAGQLAQLPRVRGPLRPGDLLIYRTDGPSRRHVALVSAPGRMIEARGRGIPIRQTSIRRDYLGAVRPGAGQ
jgi:hypothetical protein